jgi:hypothetical protein
MPSNLTFFGLSTSTFFLRYPKIQQMRSKIPRIKAQIKPTNLETNLRILKLDHRQTRLRKVSTTPEAAKKRLQRRPGRLKNRVKNTTEIHPATMLRPSTKMLMRMNILLAENLRCIDQNENG